MKNSEYEAVQKHAFGDLVKQGVFDEKFQHAEHARNFFRETILSILRELPTNRTLFVLDAGCGSGPWLSEIKALGVEHGLRRLELYGFDITPDMVDVAIRRLAELVPATHLRPGDILKSESFDFPELSQKFDLIYVYDVVQQLPRKLQFDACKLVVSKLAPNGVAIFFDQDSKSRFGRIMGIKKFLRKYFGLPLVPRYYCNAKYPPIRHFAKKLSVELDVDTEVREGHHAPKRALIARNLKIN